MINIHFHTKRLRLSARQQITVIVAVLLLSMSGCKKFLDVPPKDRVPQSSLFNDEQGFKDAMIGVYLALDKPRNGGTYGLYTDVLSMGMLSTLAYNYDNANATNVGTGGGFYNNTVSYAYADAQIKAEIAGIWGGMYSTIASLNNLLNAIDEKKTVFTKDNFYRVKGEAIAARAMLHFDLMRMFGQPPLTGATAKAIPYVRKYDTRSTPFSTLNEALDSCINDLHEAKSLLALTDTSALLQASNDLFAAYTQNHINYWTVEALLARAHLYKGNTDSARYYAKAVIGSGKFSLISSNVALANLPVRDRLFSQELLFAVYSTNVKVYNSALFDKSTGTPLRLINKNSVYTTGSGSVNDYRYISWFDNNQTGQNVPSKYFQNSNLPYPLQNIVPVVRVSEMYYIAAECANAKSNIGEAVSYLNMVRQSRGLTALNAAGISNADSVSIEIMKEYQKEFIQEGQTFFYYKRLNKDLSRVTLNTAVIPANVYVFPLPERELQYNN
jgi:hypothetical protein